MSTETMPAAHADLRITRAVVDAREIYHVRRDGKLIGFVRPIHGTFWEWMRVGGQEYTGEYATQAKAVEALLSATTPTGTPDPDDALRSAITDALGPPGDYRVLTCTRVWEAWQYGTMTEDDFGEACEDPEVIADLVKAVQPLLAAARREGKVEGLREAAAASPARPNGVCVYDWLNRRADAVEAEGSPS